MTAACDVLKPMGLVQRGRSRLWLDDRAWWLCLVEFQPSSWSRGTYLNVGVQWLWDTAWDTPGAFMFTGDDGIGARVVFPGGTQFYEYESDSQFEPLARTAVETAALRVHYFRELLSTVEAAGVALESEDVNDAVDAAIALGLSGRIDAARKGFERFLAWDDRNASTNERRAEWAEARAARVRQLLARVSDPDGFRDLIRADVEGRRDAMKLDPRSLPW
jgi:hypothetical protein